MQTINDCFKIVKKDYLKFLKKEKILDRPQADKIKSLKNFYIPLSFWIESKYQKKKKTLFLGLSGGQGSGKTTVSRILKIILKIFFKRRVHISSIDDFYKTSASRKKMSKEIHPLFDTRGVPGSHDINFIKNFFTLTKNKKNKQIKLPKFDKLKDDRVKKKYWINVKKKPEIVILEGWCVGAKPQPNYLIKKPINDLEKNEDKDSRWRKYVNQKLKNEYKKIFSTLDYFIFMKVPNFKMVFKWRLLQEHKMRKKHNSNKKIMSNNDIKRFIMHYERITLQMIKDLSKSASIVMLLKKNHQINKILFKS